MNQRRVFTLINLVLVATSGFLIYYLANASYVEPPEIRQTLETLNENETDYGPAEIQSAPDSKVVYDKLQKIQFFDALYTPTPSPTPTPRPTPMPIALNLILHPWTVVMMDATSVTFLDQAKNEEFTMTVGGPSVSYTNAGGSATVTLESVDLNSVSATVKSDKGETHQFKLE